VGQHFIIGRTGEDLVVRSVPKGENPLIELKSEKGKPIFAHTKEILEAIRLGYYTYVPLVKQEDTKA
jgi:hypothetical protein